MFGTLKVPQSESTHLIDLPVYSGPLDLLLHLIERQELDITAISLAEVADQYLEKIESMKQDRLEQLMDFLVIAAKLLLIKSRALLPQAAQEYSDGEEEEDPAEALARQLREYKRFKEIGTWLNQRQTSGLRSYLRLAAPPQMETALDLTGVTTRSLRTSLVEVFNRSGLKEESVEVATRKRNVTIDDQIRRLRTALKISNQVFFSQLLSDHLTWSEVSVTLLAILELIKRHEVDVNQPILFGPIEIRPRTRAVQPLETN